MIRFNALEMAGNAVVLANFTTLDTVTITLYDAFTKTAIPVDSNSCEEIGTTGAFIFKLSQITTALSVFTQVYFEMSNGSTIQSGLFQALGWVEGVGTVIPADMCKVSALIFTPDDQAPILPSRLQSDLEKSYAEIQGTFHQSTSGKHFDTNRQKAYYDDTGQAFWLLPQGSSVRFFIKQLNINQTVTIPAQSTADLNDLLTA